MRSTSSLFAIAPLALLLLGCPQGAGPSAPYDADDDAPDGGESDSALSVDEPDPRIDPVSRDAGPVVDPASALCGVNGQNACGPFAVCNPKLGCVECAVDADCPRSAGRCLQGACVACRGNSDCAAPSACWSVDDACHPPCGGVACPAGFSCDAASGACVGCVADADCASGVCSKALRRCVECESDGACAAAVPRCHAGQGRCVKCLSNADCGLAAPVCDPTTFTCREGCWSNGQCPGRSCDLALGRCVDTPDGG
ncbi:MAG: hypothetical protein KF819_02140 [Labilithrix sp.]|nr:hypothetical protein [Labilithrix sp.]